MHVIRILRTRVLDPIIDQIVSRIAPKLEKLDRSRVKPFSRSKTQEMVENDVFIADIYRGLLGRDPDEVGMQGFGTALTNGSLDRVGVIKAILTSEEYKHRQRVQRPSNEPEGWMMGLTADGNGSASEAAGVRLLLLVGTRVETEEYP